MGRKKKTKIPVACHKRKVEKVNVVPVKSDVKIIDIFERLDKPFVNVKNYCDEEDTIQYNFKPRRMFVNGLCLVCAKLCRPVILCDSCKMVTYCSEKHKKENRDEHKGLCEAVTQVVGLQGDFQLNAGTSPDQYRIYRVKLIELIEQKIKRHLDLWEREIILYPRICRTCYNICNDACSNCGVNFLCSDERHSREHRKWCPNFKVFRRITQLQRDYGNAKPRIPNVISNVPFELPNNFDEIVAHLIGETKLYEDMDSYNYAVLSHLATVPLTTLFAFQKTYFKEWQQMETLTIHIIGAEFEFECADFKFWETLFLHFLPSLKELKLVIIGPELQAPQYLLDALTTIQLCTYCCSKRKFIRLEFHPAKLYHEITTLSKPNLICLFNPGLYRHTGYSSWDTWPETIKAFCRHKVPVVVTSYTEYEIPKDVERIESICSIEVLLKAQRNIFASLKPDRNFVSDHTDPLIFKNYCIAVVQGN